MRDNAHEHERWAGVGPPASEKKPAKESDKMIDLAQYRRFFAKKSKP